MSAMRLNSKDTIGIVSPCQIATVDHYSSIIHGLNQKGFQVKLSENIYKNTYGYLASETERAEDINKMVLDDSVKMIFFGGGEGANEVLPYLDYSNIERHPKIFLSYSDGTSILDTIYLKTGLITFYGQTPGIFTNIQNYDYKQFISHFIDGNVKEFKSNSKWYSLNKGVCDGILVGGYLGNIALLINSDYFMINKQKKYILFLEDHEKFSNISHVSALLSHIEQSGFVDNVSGLLFGNYSDDIHPYLLQRLERFGKKYNVPVAYCDDFGHGANHAILPIGSQAILNTKDNTLMFEDL